MNLLTFGFIESEAKILLESLFEKEERMSRICASSDDEDLVADVGNDLIELRLLLNALKEKAVQAFGDSVLNLGTEPL